MALEKNSPCKVNLLLNILGRRPDGFHELETVMHPVNLCDRLAFERGGRGVEMTCSGASLGRIQATSFTAPRPSFSKPRRSTTASASISKKKSRSPPGWAAAAATRPRRCSD